MTNTFGGFVHTSPLASQPHDPPLTLASNCVRDFFGPIVQTVFDALVKTGGTLTLSALVSCIRKQCTRILNGEREKLIVRGKYKLQRAKGPSSNGYVVEASSIRAGLLVLLQHDIVSVSGISPRPHYTVDPRKARLVTRYPKWIEYVKKVMDETAAKLVETLLLEGKASTVDAIFQTVENLSEVPKSDRYTQRQAVVETFHRLVEGNFVEKVAPLFIEEDEVEKEQKAKQPTFEDPAIVSILSNAPYKTTLPRHAVWRLNWKLIQSSLKSFCLGRLVAERYGHRVVSAGSIVTAALKFQSYNGGEGIFSASEISTFLPKPVQQSLEKKPGGLLVNLSKSLVDLSHFDYPHVVDEIEEAHGHAQGGKFSISTTKLVKHLRDRTIHQFLFHCYGDLAARIASVLRVKGSCEAEPLAEAAMVPAKDTREILHRMYRDNLVQLLNLQQGKQHNPASMIYLWSVNHSHLLRVVRDKVCTAMLNLRFRRQHESEYVGKAWMERASQEEDENENKEDKEQYNKFCQGLERLDFAMMQLDETLMVLFDF